MSEASERVMGMTPQQTTVGGLAGRWLPAGRPTLALPAGGLRTCGHADGGPNTGGRQVERAAIRAAGPRGEQDRHRGHTQPGRAAVRPAAYGQEHCRGPGAHPQFGGDPRRVPQQQLLYQHELGA